MSGTSDFIDAAVDSLKQGNHSFVLLTVDDITGKTGTYKIRCGYRSRTDLPKLEELLQTEVADYMKEIQQQHE